MSRLKNMWCRLVSRVGRGSSSNVRTRQTCRPHLEALEDRLAPSVTVTTTRDAVSATDGALSLREAIDMVNAGSVPDNTILLPAGLYRIGRSGALEDNNASWDFDVKHALIL